MPMPRKRAIWDESRWAKSPSSSGTLADVHQARRTVHQRLPHRQEGLAGCGTASTARLPSRLSLSQFIRDMLPQRVGIGPQSLR